SVPQRLAMHLGRLLSPPPGRGRWSYLWQRLVSLKEKLYWRLGLGHRNAPPLPGLDMLPQDALRHVWAALHTGYWRYQPQGRFAGAVAVIRTEEMDDWDALVCDDPLLGWARCADGPVEAHVLPGGHLELFEERNIDRLAGGVRDCAD